MTTRTRTVLAANVAPGMRVRRSNHLDWTTIPEAPSAYGWPPRLDGLAPVSVPPGERTTRRLGLPWPASARAPGCAGGRWGSALRRESSRQWMRDHRARRREALAAAASGTITVPAPPPVASHPRPKRKA